MNAFAPDLIPQLDAVLAEGEGFRSRSKYTDWSDLSEWEVHRLATRARAAIERITGPSSPYARQADAALNAGGFYGEQVQRVIGVVECLRDDLRAGYLTTIKELLHADLFADFLEMSEHLLGEGYKDAAAVIAGSSLEAHLRQLAEKHGIATAEVGRPKKADKLNSDLCAAGAYSKLDQKAVISWLDLRNKAAHGHYDGYSQSQVEVILHSIREFISRLPA